MVDTACVQYTTKRCIRDEGTIRQIVKLIYRESMVTFVEPALGSTTGMSDCILVNRGQVLFLELKCGTYDKKRNMIKYTLRPAQKKTLRELQERMASVAVLVGIRGKNSLFLIPAHADGFFEGKVQLGATVYYAEPGLDTERKKAWDNAGGNA